ncbi:MAG: hypothetical protein JWM04_1536 [Verrucomicrobiales bacterium]|nr:hypothetical protein [Verrucomicrobiales bacterium]
MKTVVLILLLAASVIWGVFEARKNQQLQMERSELQKEHGELEEWRAQEPEIKKLKAEAAQVETFKKQGDELNKLRNETKGLRDISNRLVAANAEISKLRAAMNMPKAAPVTPQERVVGVPVTRDQWTNGGYNSPEAAFETTLWAGRELNAEAYLNAFAPDLRSKLEKDIQTNGFEDHIKKRFTDLNNATLLGKNIVSPDQVELQYQVDGWNKGKPFIQSMKNVNGEWKVSGAPRYQ